MIILSQEKGHIQITFATDINQLITKFFIAMKNLCKHFSGGG